MNRGFKVKSLAEGTPAHKAGIKQGDRILKINGTSFFDVLDYSYLSADEKVELQFYRNGNLLQVKVVKDMDEDLGIEFFSPTVSPLYFCRNKCIFCFIDQQPGGMRLSLYEKDDDYRLSFIDGNYVTLTNVQEADLKRIISMNISPLYISIHATDGAVRKKMMGNVAAGRIMEQLAQLSEAGIEMHGQVVVCPGINDGDVLQKTVWELASLYPQLKTIALVPVGLTRYRGNLKPLKKVTQNKAQQIVKEYSSLQNVFQQEMGSPFVYLADDFYLLSGASLPSHEHYGDYHQLENGVGLCRLFLNELLDWKRKTSFEIKNKTHISIATGQAAAPFLQLFIRELEKIKNLETDLHIIENRFWGGNVDVAGLLTGRDLFHSLYQKNLGDYLFISSAMLKAGTDLFLDGVNLKALSVRLQTPVVPVNALGEIRKFIVGHTKNKAR